MDNLTSIKETHMSLLSARIPLSYCFRTVAPTFYPHSLWIGQTLNMIEIILGTYDGFVIGYKINEVGSRYSIDQSFAVRGHSSPVGCLASFENGTKVLSAAEDEVTHLFDMKKRKLMHSIDLPVSCSAFVDESHIICGCEDGKIYIYELKGKSMELAKTLKGHTESITSIGVHPSGKLLLSLSKDNNMRTWNLIKGRCAYVTRQVKPQAHLVCWSKTGDNFFIAANNEVYLYNISGNLEHSLKLGKRINSIEFLDKHIFVIASDCRMHFYDLRGCKSMFEVAQDARIKCARLISTDNSKNLIATASSNGYIKLWSTDKSISGEPQELASVETGARLISMTSVLYNDENP